MKKDCPIPFKVISIDVLGNIQCCPKLFWKNKYSIWNIDKKSFYYEWINNKKIVNIRKNIINNEENDLCKLCNYKDKYINNYKNELLSDDFSPSIFEIRFSNLCNFSCKMCYPNASSLIAKKKNNEKYIYKGEKILKNKTFWSDFEKILPSLRLIYIWWWEPFINPTHYIFLEKIINLGYSKKIKIIYHSNLSIIPWITWLKSSKILLWRKNIIDFWKHFKKIDVFWSCDWIGEMYEKIRIWWKWKIFEKNALFLNKIWVLWWISTTIQKDNINDLVNIENWATKNKINIDFKILKWPKRLSIN